MVLSIPYPARFKVAKIFLPDEPRPNKFVGLLIERKIIGSIDSSISLKLIEIHHIFLFKVVRALPNFGKAL
ncbi:MAG: hypothetical protein Q7R94_00280 [bacterium]|nr:hypothetical protein [bacterium]